jgi:predicted acyltransferase
LFIAIIYTTIYWLCKAFNRFYLSKADENHQPSVENASKVKKRLKSLDIFRGIAILLMIFANSGGGRYWWIDHAVWNGLHIADLVFPWFLFIMGVCIPMSIRSQLYHKVPKNQIILKIVKV